MEEIQITEEQEQKLISLFTKLKKLWGVFFVIGLAGFIPIGITYFVGSATSFHGSPTIVFFILGIIIMGNSENAKKKIKKKEYQVFKTKCIKKKMFEYVLVENNEILSKKVKKPLKWILFLGSPKLIKIDEEIGIFRADKDFWAFSLNE